MALRNYGILANSCKRKAMLLIRRLIGKVIEIWHVGKETTQEKMLRLTGKDILHCPYCKQGRMIYQGAILSVNTS